MSIGSNNLKSFRSSDPLVKYCTELSVRFHPLQQQLHDRTLAETGQSALMMGAPEVLQFGANMIQTIKARNILDIGTFTGASALAWAYALAEDNSSNNNNNNAKSQIITIDINREYFDKIGRPIFDRIPEITSKITFKLGSALQVLDELIENGESGKFDFAFIDVDKVNYSNYYERCLQLLRPGGIILIDNALWSGKVLDKAKDAGTEAIDKLNRFAHKDPRVRNSLLNLGDGTHVIFKK